MSAAPKLARNGDASSVIYVSLENWHRLNLRRKPGITFNDVVTALLDAEDKR